MVRSLFFAFELSDSVEVCIIAKSKNDAIAIFKDIFGDVLYSKVIKIY